MDYTFQTFEASRHIRFIARNEVAKPKLDFMERSSEHDEAPATEHGSHVLDSRTLAVGYDDPSMQPTWNFKARKLLTKQQSAPLAHVGSATALTRGANDAKLPPELLSGHSIQPLRSLSQRNDRQDVEPPSASREVIGIQDDHAIVAAMDFESSTFHFRDRAHSDSKVRTCVDLVPSILTKSYSESDMEDSDFTFRDSLMDSGLIWPINNYDIVTPNESQIFQVGSLDKKDTKQISDEHKRGTKPPPPFLDPFNASTGKNGTMSVNGDSVDVKTIVSTAASTTITETSKRTRRMQPRTCRFVVVLIIGMIMVIVAIAVVLAVEVRKAQHRVTNKPIIVSPTRPPASSARPTRVGEKAGSARSPIAPSAYSQPHNKRPVVSSPIRLASLPPFPNHETQMTRHPVIPPNFLQPAL